jgi:hypothetical protein
MKRVKKNGVLAMLLITVNVFAINSSSKITGLYKSESDFVSNKLTYPIDCASQDGSISADNIFKASQIVIKENGKKIMVPKTDFFGYRDCNNVAYRFFGNQAYEILDATGFYLYKRTFNMSSGKGSQMVTAYYFSKDGSSSLQLLTKQNLENEYASNTSFRYALESAFHDDSELTAYDNYLKCFKVKYIFNESTKK